MLSFEVNKDLYNKACVSLPELTVFPPQGFPINFSYLASSSLPPCHRAVARARRGRGDRCRHLTYGDHLALPCLALPWPLAIAHSENTRVCQDRLTVGQLPPAGVGAGAPRRTDGHWTASIN